MIDQSDSRLAELQDRVSARRDVQTRLTQARDALAQNLDRLDSIEVSIVVAEEEIRNLESFSLAGVMSSFFGTKAGKIDGYRQECEELQQQYSQCEHAVKSLTKQVEMLTSELATYADVEEVLEPPPAPIVDDLPALPMDSRRKLERAHEAAQSLLNHLGGMSKLCNHLRSGPSPFGRPRGIIAAGMQAYRRNVATGVTVQISGSVRHLCDQIRDLDLDGENPDDRELLAALAQIERFGDASGAALTNNDDWAELEVLARSFESDLEERLARAGD